MKLENWSIVPKPDPYKPPEFWKQYINGDVYDHPYRPDGQNITTSQIVGMTKTVFKTRSGSEYEIGTVSEEYERQFPDARNRAYKALNNA